jgi:COMPASS (Complex proteins associated with Set1p) component shg1
MMTQTPSVDQILSEFKRLGHFDTLRKQLLNQYTASTHGQELHGKLSRMQFAPPINLAGVIALLNKNWAIERMALLLKVVNLIQSNNFLRGSEFSPLIEEGIRESIESLKVGGTKPVEVEGGQIDYEAIVRMNEAMRAEKELENQRLMQSIDAKRTASVIVNDANSSQQSQQSIPIANDESANVDINVNTLSAVSVSMSTDVMDSITDSKPQKPVAPPIQKVSPSRETAEEINPTADLKDFFSSSEDSFLGEDDTPKRKAEDLKESPIVKKNKLIRKNK